MTALVLLLLRAVYCGNMCDEYASVCTCEVKEKAEYMLLHRTPKCGSGTSKRVLRNLLGDGFNINVMSRELIHPLTEKLARNPQLLTGQSSPVQLFQGHISYFPFSNAELNDLYVRYSQIREPISRTRSLFYYKQLTKRISRDLKLNSCFESGFCSPPPEILSLSLDEPMYMEKVYGLINKRIEAFMGSMDEADWPGAEPDMRMLIIDFSTNFLMRFFCGSQRLCLTGSANEILREAKRVIAEEMAIVSPAENTSVSLFYLTHLAPKIFGNLPMSTFKNLPEVHSSYEGIVREEFSDAVKSMLLKFNFLDVELYKFAVEVFEEKVKGCKGLIEKDLRKRKKEGKGWWQW